jgi:hypothetical protein
MQHQQVRSCKWSDAFILGLVTCSATSTLYSAVVGSPATARLALSWGLLAIGNQNLHMVAGLHADIPTLVALAELGMPHSNVAVLAAALSGRLHILQHLLDTKVWPKPRVLGHYAARSGSVSMLNWLKAQSWCPFDDYTCDGAAIGGHLAILQQLRSDGCEWDVESIACYAACSGSIELVEWLRQQGIAINAEVLAWAAGSGHIALCEHLRSRGCDWDADACNEAASYGDVNMLRWLRERGCPCNAGEVCISAARHNFTDILDYLIEQGEQLSAEVLTNTLNCAGTHNQLRAAQWLRQHGANWPAVLIHDVMGDGHSALMQWHSDTLAWARAEGCDSPVYDTTAQ